MFNNAHVYDIIVFVSVPTEVFQRIRLLCSLQDAIFNNRAHAQKRAPRTVVTTPMRHDCIYTSMVPNLALPRLLIVSQRQRARHMAYYIGAM